MPRLACQAEGLPSCQAIELRLLASRIKVWFKKGSSWLDVTHCFELRDGVYHVVCLSLTEISMTQS
eukprot:m.30050 g.30050  ORF g.30050 m.30050 type:complete len:66 (-) comp12002_c0_seq1:520-717(-)